MTEPVTTPQPEGRGKRPIGCCNCGRIPLPPQAVDDGFQVACRRCGTAGPISPTPAEAVKLWNGMRGAYRTCPTVSPEQAFANRHNGAAMADPGGVSP